MHALAPVASARRAGQQRPGAPVRLKGGGGARRMAATIDEMNEGIERRTCWNEESKRFMAKVMEVSGLGPSTFLPDGAPSLRATQSA